MGSKGSNEVQQSTTQSYTPNPLTAGLAKQTGTLFSQAAAQPYSNMPIAPVAGFTPDQLAAFQNTRGSQGWAQPYINAAMGFAGQSGAPVTAQDVESQFNPYFQSQLAALNRDIGISNRDLRGNLRQSAGGVGADRIAVGEGLKFEADQMARGRLAGDAWQQALNSVMAQKQLAGAAGSNIGALAQTGQGLNWTDIANQYNMGSQQQQLAQAMLNAPYNWAVGRFQYPMQLAGMSGALTSQLAPALGGTQTGNQTTTYPEQSLLPQLVGLAGAGLRAFMNPGGTLAGMASGIGSGIYSGLAGSGQNPQGMGRYGPYPYAYGGEVDGYAEGGDVDPNANYWANIGNQAQSLAAPVATSMPQMRSAPPLMNRLMSGGGKGSQFMSRIWDMYNRRQGQGMPSASPEMPSMAASNPFAMPRQFFGGASGGFVDAPFEGYQEGGLIDGNLSDMDMTFEDGTWVPKYDPTDPQSALPVRPGVPNPPPMAFAGAEADDTAGGRPTPRGLPPGIKIASPPSLPGFVGPQEPAFPQSNPLSNFLINMGARMMQGTGRDARGLPVGGGPFGQLLSAAGSGVGSGMDALQRQRAQERQDIAEFNKIQALLHKARMGNLPYEGITAAEALQESHRDEITPYQRELLRIQEKRADAEAGRRARLPSPLQTDLGKKGQALQRLDGLIDNFDVGYGGAVLPKVGDIKNWIARQTGIGNKEAANWWQGYQDYKGEVRHGRYGAALTGYEIGEWTKQDINPGMQEDVIRENLARQKRIVDGAIRRRMESLMKQGYSKEAVEAEIGKRLEDLPSPVDEKGKWKEAFDKKVDKVIEPPTNAPKVGEERVFKDRDGRDVTGVWDGKQWKPK